MTAVEWRDDPSGWRTRAGCASHVGNYRERNEDHVHLDAEHPLALVLDGMGGYPGGELAAATGAEAVAAALRDGLSAGDAPEALIERALRTGNDAVLALSRSAPDLKNCGTTVTFAFLSGGVVWVSWLGDSPAFRASGDRVEALTRPHNLLRALIDAGRISEAEGGNYRGGHQLWKYLGSPEAQPPFDAVSFVPRPGDALLLATDGIPNVVPDAELLAVCGAFPDPLRCAEELVRAALDRGSRDNCTCAVLRFEWIGDGPPPDPPPARPEPAARKWWQFWR